MFYWPPQELSATNTTDTRDAAVSRIRIGTVPDLFDQLSLLSSGFPSLLSCSCLYRKLPAKELQQEIRCRDYFPRVEGAIVELQVSVY